MIEKELKKNWTFKLKPSTRANLEELAKAEGRSSSDYLERMINRIHTLNANK